MAFIYWEGGIILHELEERRKQQQGEGGSQPPNKPLTHYQQLIYERKRGLAWLAIVTAVSIWCTGVVNTPSPFQP